MSDLQKARAMTTRLLDDLDAMLTHPALRMLGDMVLESPDAAGINNANRAAFSLQSQIDSLHKLGQTMEILGMLGATPDDKDRAEVMWKLSGNGGKTEKDLA